MSKGECGIDDCGKPVDVRGWCRAHYRRWQRYGDPLGLPPRALITVEDRLWPRVDKNGSVPACRPDLGPCWIWTGAQAAGYGVIWVDRRNVGTHRVSYELLVGPIPEDLVLDHLCRNALCCNPAHLEPVADGVNILRGISPFALNAAKTHCPKGHRYDEQNTYHEPGRKGRQCKTCVRERQQEEARRLGIVAHAARTRCPQDHPYDEANTYWHNGHRSCKACRRERVRAARAGKAASGDDSATSQGSLL
jgi:hypothetical protein